MPKHSGETLADRRLTGLIELADECHLVPFGYRLRFTRTSTTLLRVVNAIDANPTLRFRMTTDETGACWLAVEMPGQRGSRPRTSPAPRPAVPVVA